MGPAGLETVLVRAEFLQMHAHDADRFHAFSRLVLTLSDSALEGVRSDHTFELRATAHGAEVWRGSELHAGGDSVSSGERYVGSLTSRQVIDLLVQIERSGVYEALPIAGIVDGAVSDEVCPTVSMRLLSEARERDVLDQAPATHEIVDVVVQAVRDKVELAAERALTSAG